MYFFYLTFILRIVSVSYEEVDFSVWTEKVSELQLASIIPFMKSFFGFYVTDLFILLPGNYILYETFPNLWV